ncbi:DUF1048 domain-containing protein [Actinoplanes sp. TRM 88003]|uniref:DUF1048 domain-containing protein n=1 Tax=Paractinoplanes aksuensis TaxID=2939490 RepID=A0ABT1E2V7_9ACTN|nr:DUF1048 domain-containing protein [Actinoplanes aksuensis]MCO8277475.1 DUF1048 domain-containing protein [Actinoplanes aksuensis]
MASTASQWPRSPVASVLLRAEVAVGDLTAVAGTGAYHHRGDVFLGRPPVLGVAGGLTRTLVRRETLETCCAARVSGWGWPLELWRYSAVRGTGGGRGGRSDRDAEGVANGQGVLGVTGTDVAACDDLIKDPRTCLRNPGHANGYDG